MYQFKEPINSNGEESEWSGAKRFKRLQKVFKDPMIWIFSVVVY